LISIVSPHLCRLAAIDGPGLGPHPKKNHRKAIPYGDDSISLSGFLSNSCFPAEILCLPEPFL
jgi:hypothetical protein